MKLMKMALAALALTFAVSTVVPSVVVAQDAPVKTKTKTKTKTKGGE